jgi:hypothetical protein
MRNKNLLFGAPVHKYVEMNVFVINNILKNVGCVRAKALCKNEEQSVNCKFSCIGENDTTPFIVTLGNALGIKIRDLWWVSNNEIGIIFDMP